MAQEGARALAQALRYLSYRPRSRAELQGRLGRRFPSSAVAEALSQLEALNLLDDVAFARLWRQSREASSPRSRSLVERELRQKGVDIEVAREATASLEDEANAYQAAQRKGLTLSNQDEDTFRRRLAAHLLRRGFSFSLIRHTVDRVWSETKPINLNIREV